MTASIELARMMAVRNFRHRADIAEAEGSLTLASLHRETADRIEAGIQDNNADVQDCLARLSTPHSTEER